MKYEVTPEEFYQTVPSGLRDSRPLAVDCKLISVIRVISTE